VLATAIQAGRVTHGRVLALSQTCSGWPVRRVRPGKGVGFTAHRRLEGGLQQLHAPTLADLEHRVWLAKRTGGRRG
jgi:hypothetical protein